MNQRGQLTDALIGGVVVLVIFMALVPVYDALLNTTFNLLEGSTNISQVGSIELLLGLIVFIFAVAIFIMIVKTSLGQGPRDQGMI